MGLFDDVVPQSEPGASAGGLFSDVLDQTPQKSSALRRGIADPALSLLKGAISVPEAAVGLADIPTLGIVGKAAEGLGFRPKEAKAEIDTWYSPEQQAANRAVQESKGFVPTLQAAVQNPSVIGHTVLESAPSMLGGAGIARGLLGAGGGALSRAAGSTAAPIIAGAAGEGAVGAGMAAEQIRQETPDGMLSPAQSAAAAASGIGTGLLGAIGGGLARKLGLSDVDTMLAGGVSRAGARSLPARVVGGAISEGVLEEMPQSAQEQAWQNVALGRPTMEGVAEQAAIGGLAGAAMGGLGGTIPAAPRSPAPGPLQKALDASPTPPVPANTGTPTPPVPANTGTPTPPVPVTVQQAAADNTTEPKVGGDLPQPQQNTPAAPESSPPLVSTADLTAQTNQAESAGVPISQPQEGAVVRGNETEVAEPAGAGQQAQPAAVSDSSGTAGNGGTRGAVPGQPAQDINLQNRDRSRAASVIQMGEIARNPDYMRLGPSRTPDSGAPMVFAVGDDRSSIPEKNFGNSDVAVMSDGQRVPFRYALVDASQVEPSNFADGRVNPAFSSGQAGTIKALNNGRAAGLRAAYEIGTAGMYQTELANDLANVGISPDALQSAKNPILVRVYSDTANTSGMAAKSQAQGLGMSPAELARQDAQILDSSVLDMFQHGDVAAANNRDFVRAFVGSLQESGQDIAGMMTDAGTLSPTGRQRIQAALMQAAYGDADLVAEMFDSLDTDIKAIGEALKAIAGPWANMRRAARIGAISPEADITGNLIAAVRLIQKARRERTSLYDLVNQRDIETGEAVPYLTVGTLRLFYTGKLLTRPVGKDKLVADLEQYVSLASATSASPDMFGHRSGAEDLLAATTRGREDEGVQVRREPAGVPPAGPGADGTRQEGSGRGGAEGGGSPSADSVRGGSQSEGEGAGLGLALGGKTKEEVAADEASLREAARIAAPETRARLEELASRLNAAAKNASDADQKRRAEEQILQTSGKSVAYWSKLAARHGHDEKDAAEKILARPSAWMPTLTSWQKQERLEALARSRQGRADRWSPDEAQQKILRMIHENPTRSEATDAPMFPHNSKATKELIARGAISRSVIDGRATYRIADKWVGVAAKKEQSAPGATDDAQASVDTIDKRGRLENLAERLRDASAKAVGERKAKLERLAEQLEMSSKDWIGSTVSFLSATGKRKLGSIIRVSGQNAVVVSNIGQTVVPLRELKRSKAESVPLRGFPANDTSPLNVKALEYATRELEHGSPHWYVAKALADDVFGDNSKLTSSAFAYVLNADKIKLWKLIDAVARQLASGASSNGAVRRTTAEFVARQSEMSSGNVENTYRQDIVLAGQTPDEVAAAEAEAKAAADKEAKARQDAEKARKDAEERAEIRRRSEAAAQSFELGGDAMANLSGQGDMFGAPPPAAVPSRQPASNAGELPPDANAASDDLGALFDNELEAAFSKPKEEGNEPGSVRNSQRDRQAADAQRGDAGALSDERGREGAAPGGGVPVPDANRRRGRPGGPGVSGVGAASGGERGDQPVPGAERPAGVEKLPAGDNQRQGSADVRPGGVAASGGESAAAVGGPAGGGVGPRSASEAGKSAAKNAGLALADVANGLNALFKPRPGRLGTGLPFDEDTYAAAKPYFQAGLEHFRQAGADIVEMMRALIAALRDQFGMDKDTIAAMKPYVLRYISDVQAGREAIEETNPQQPPKDKLQQQQAAESIKVIVGDKANIDATLPFLTEGQREDVLFAEKRWSAPDGYGVLFTNGTGTGKTFLALGAIKRLTKQGKGSGIVVVPNEAVMSEWVKSAPALGLKITPLADTKDAGSGIAITTYANFGQNDDIAKRDYDFVAIDEAHLLMLGKEAESTEALEALRAISLHPDGVLRRAEMQNRELVERIATNQQRIRGLLKSIADPDTMDQIVFATRKEIEGLDKTLDDDRQKWRGIQDRVQADVLSRQGEKRPRVMFLSATPFAYEQNIKWGEGFLYEFPKVEGRGYNAPDAYGAFMIQHFGWRMRTGRLTQPDDAVDRDLMQRQFNSWLRKQGVLSARMLDVDQDYERKFILLEGGIGQKIDEGLKWLRDAENGRYWPLYDAINGRFDYLTRARLLESIKARAAIPYIRKHQAMGRKVVVFYDFNTGGGINVFNVDRDLASAEASERRQEFDPEKEGLVVPARGQAQAPWGSSSVLQKERVTFAQLLREFVVARPDLQNLDFSQYASPLATLTQAFPDAGVYNGMPQYKKSRLRAIRDFNDDAKPQANLLLVQKAANAGWSGHDTTGTHMRVLINLGLPTAPIEAIQQEGRIYRVGQRSDANFHYFNTGTNWERYAFGSRIARRAGTAENLAMGEQARGLREAFIQAFENSDPGYEPSAADGKGGKTGDRALITAITDWDRAKALYFAQQKKTARTKAAEGEDYYATPEPLGLKMVEWAGILPGERVLEPSAGHGAIARWLPEKNDRTVIEPSLELASRLTLATDAKLVNERFEDHGTINKYDAIVMNPPFGAGGKMAIEHLDKAFRHLTDGGRLVALIPEGPAANKRFNDWLHGDKTVKAKSVGASVGQFGEVFEGDTATVEVSGVHDTSGAGIGVGSVTGKVVRFREGKLFVKREGEDWATGYRLDQIRAVQPTGARTATVKSAPNAYLRASIGLPAVTFERAGTGVKTRVVIIDKVEGARASRGVETQPAREIGSGSVKDLFDAIENMDVVGRALPAEKLARNQQAQMRESARKATAGETNETGMVQPDGSDATVEAMQDAQGPTDTPKLLTDAPRVSHVTRAGKTIHGVIAKTLKRNQAEAIDPFTWPKDGGFFIRLAHVVRPTRTSTAEQGTLPTSNAVGNVVFSAALAGRFASAADRAVFDMAQEGKPAAEILSFISKSSRRPFNRVLAAALRRSGVASAVTVDGSGGWQFGNRSYAQRYAAAYNPKTDTVALFTPNEAERHLLHELTHAATLRAISAGGPAAARMRALFRHVQKSGRLDGQYGMKDVDEFVAEAFSNPRVQEALRGVPAPAGSTLKSAWQWFVRVVARVVGIKTRGAETALDRALTVGAELMRENSALSETASVGDARFAVDAPADVRLTEARIDKLFRQYAYSTDDKRTKAHIAWVAPDDFLRATTTNETMRRLEREKAPLDVAALRQETQDIQLIGDLDGNQWKLTDHEGRHRMLALRDAGVTQVPVVFYSGNGKRQDVIRDVVVTPQQTTGGSLAVDRGFSVTRLIPINNENRSTIEREFGGDANIRFNIATDWQQSPVAQRVSQAFSAATRSDASLSWLNPVQTQYHKAETLAKQGKPMFKRVFDLGQKFLSDISRFAVMAENSAPTLFHQIRSLSDARQAAGAVLGGDFGRQRNADVRAIAAPLYEGTLYGGGDPTAGIVWSDEQLSSRFGLNDRQIGLYREAREAVRVSMEEMAKSLISRHAKREHIIADTSGSLQEVAENVRDTLNLRADVLEDKAQGEHDDTMRQAADLRKAGEDKRAGAMEGEAADKLKAKQADVSRIRATVDDVLAIAAKAQTLQEAGYFPLMRFGRHTVTAKDEKGNVRHFSMHDGIPLVPRSGQVQANRLADALRDEHPDWTVTTGLMNPEKYKLYQGMNVEALQLFSDHLDDETRQTYQEIIRLSTNDRSALRRMLKREGTPGFDRDVRRTLASFILSNARYTASSYHLSDMAKAAELAEQDGGDIGAEAVKLYDYLTKPQEEAAKARGFLFFNFLGGSLAAAMVNATQVPMMTFPRLSQYESAGKLAARLARAARMATKNPQDIPGEVGVALRRAEEDGITAPHQIYEMTATASNNIFAGSMAGGALLRAWGAPFAVAESFNRRATFIAAWQIGNGMTAEQLRSAGAGNATEFAEKMVHETQGIYNRGNRVNLGRGTVGAVVMTFKQFSIMYLEMLSRLPPKQKAIMVGMLILAAGAGGLPFAEDVEDIIDTIGQWLGYRTNTRRTIRRGLADIAGQRAADIAMNGVLSQMGIDLHSRLGLQNLIPGSALLKPSTTDKSREFQDLIGPAASVVAAMGQALQDLATGRPDKAALAMAPVAVQNAVKGAGMLATGSAADMRGKPTVPVSAPEAVAKAVGFNPKSVADYGVTKRDIMQDERLIDVTRERFTAAIVDAIMSDNETARREAVQEVADWNRQNPEARITINPAAIRRRVRDMRAEGPARVVKSLSPSLRQQARKEFSDAQG